MKYCSHCGRELLDEAVVCPGCGCPVEKSTDSTEFVNGTQATTPVMEEGSSFGWGVLGFFIPLVGLILFCVWKQTKPRAAKAAGIGALIGFVLGIVWDCILVFSGALNYIGYYGNYPTILFNLFR
jgi:hypothetical protein